MVKNGFNSALVFGERADYYGRHGDARNLRLSLNSRRKIKTISSQFRNKHARYSSRKLRNHASANGVRTVIPYPANQHRREKKLLRVDRYFRTHGPPRETRIYRQRAAVERVNSRLKEHLDLNRHRVKGLRNIAVHALLCIIAMLLTALATLQLNEVEKTRCVTLLGR
jgi:hypothetical protein